MFLRSVHNNDNQSCSNFEEAANILADLFALSFTTVPANPPEMNFDPIASEVHRIIFPHQAISNLSK